jgi:hypothetical protein
MPCAAKNRDGGRVDGTLALTADLGNDKLQVLRIRTRPWPCLSLCSSVRNLRKGVNEPKLTPQ